MRKLEMLLVTNTGDYEKTITGTEAVLWERYFLLAQTRWTRSKKYIIYETERKIRAEILHCVQELKTSGMEL